MTVAACYNAGPGAIATRLANQHQSSSMDLWLVSETSRYMFRVLTAKLFFEHPESFGFHVADEDKYKYVPPRQVVTVNETIPDLVAFAEKHGTTYARLKEANLWLREAKLNDESHRTYEIIIPR